MKHFHWLKSVHLDSHGKFYLRGSLHLRSMISYRVEPPPLPALVHIETLWAAPGKQD